MGGNNAMKNNKLLNKVSKIVSGDKLTNASQIGILVAAFVVTLLVLMFIKYLINSKLNEKKDSPYLIKGTKNGKNSFVIPQDPQEEGSITLYRSHDQDKGMEFSYSFWMMVDSFSYKTGEWKHIFHKGNSSGYPNRAPGVYLHPDKNAMRVYMNTYEHIMDYVDVDNIPIKKWVCVVICLNQKDLDIYINGYLRKRHTLKGLPRQNFGDVWINLFGGFEGYISKLRYYRKGLEYNEIENIVKEGPSKGACGDTDEIPPYLDDNWWYDF